MRWDVMAAGASTFAAIASAAAAFVALYYAAEGAKSAADATKIASAQVDATYFSHLYNQQVDVYARLYGTMSKFNDGLISQAGSIIAGLQNNPQREQRDLRSRLSAAAPRGHDISAQVDAAKLVSPNTLEKALDHLDTVARKILTDIETYADTHDLAAFDLDGFKVEFRAGVDGLSAESQAVFHCVRRVLRTGHPLTAAGVATCELPQ